MKKKHLSLILSLIIAVGLSLWYLNYAPNSLFAPSRNPSQNGEEASATASQANAGSENKILKEQHATINKDANKPYPLNKLFKDKNFKPKAERGMSTKFIEEHFQGSEIRLNNVKYVISDNLQNVPKSSYQPHLGDFIAEKGQYVLFEGVDTSIGEPVLLNQQTKRMAIVTGKITILAGSKLDLSKHRLITGENIDDSMSHLDRYAIQVPPEKNIFEVLRQLEEDPNIEVELELIEGVHHAK